MATKLDLCVRMGDRSLPVWRYDSVPEGVRPARASDLRPGTPVLHLVRVGPDAGKYYQDYVRATTIGPLRSRIRSGEEVYVKQ
jgi:hypothetical protein